MNTISSNSNNIEANALSWTATIGLVAGYHHDNDPDNIVTAQKRLIDSWNNRMGETLQKTKHCVSAVITPSIVLYPEKFGCPSGGENALTLCGSSNPSHVGKNDIESFRQAVIDTVRAVKLDMKQQTVRIEFHMITVEYLTK